MFSWEARLVLRPVSARFLGEALPLGEKHLAPPLIGCQLGLLLSKPFERQQEGLTAMPFPANWLEELVTEWLDLDGYVISLDLLLCKASPPFAGDFRRPLRGMTGHARRRA